ncbi:hypothetical protein [Leptolyngbya sp. FACHB-17]|uniref:hypothetical protein n=1 Tax=Leptolyngbya sp. FACHB-17 TaxID=2692803 RepID=UPI00168116E1|nr:hypothetical protein [Leptolyngbya sp. FACHB-17]MBD2082520.1 hypothetical protein [Leptolyngbya sp. FACHB-17]
MNVHSRYRPSAFFALIAGFAVVLGICHYYQRISSKPVFPIDKSTLTIARVDQPGNSEV